ncbi:acireductone dioxygenase isoform X1 [Leptinotarsa decemlineata]|uniref:acireductone dioxygenase isoform X1 n=1 Tax=Leptinotarsa decemlineata TaxID=7539 RepID=UPI003D306223
MVRAWFMDNDHSDQRKEHHRNPPQFIELDELFKLSGVEYFKLNIDTLETDGILEKLKKERGYTYEDEIVISEGCLQNYEEKLKIFYTEHLHTDEEIRLVVKGSGYFDVRDKNDEWIRIEVVPGDLLILPSGIYHRFTLDEKVSCQISVYILSKHSRNFYRVKLAALVCSKARLSGRHIQAQYIQSGHKHPSALSFERDKISISDKNKVKRNNFW